MSSIFMGALGGAGSAMQDVGSTMLKSELQRQNLAADRQQENDLTTQRQKTLEEFKQSLADAPLNRLSAKAKEMAAQEVPQEPGKVTSFSGAGSGGPASFTGDPGIVQRAIANLPEPDRTAAMEQFQRQLAADEQANADAVAGKTRKRTNEEAMQAAADDAKVNDLPAYAAYEKDVGKPSRDERRVANQEKREDTRASTAAALEHLRLTQEQRRQMIDLARLDLQQGNLDAQNKKIDAWIDNEAAKRENDENKANNPKASSPERLYSIVNAMNATVKQLQEGSKGSTPEQKAEWQRQMDTAVRVRDRASQLLDQNMETRGATPAASPSPAAAPSPKPAASGSGISTLPPGSRQVGTSGGKPVYQTPDGKRFIAQ